MFIQSTRGILQWDQGLAVGEEGLVMRMGVVLGWGGFLSRTR